MSKVGDFINLNGVIYQAQVGTDGTCDDCVFEHNKQRCKELVDMQDVYGVDTSSFFCCAMYDDCKSVIFKDVTDDYAIIEVKEWKLVDTVKFIKKHSDKKYIHVINIDWVINDEEKDSVNLPKDIFVPQDTDVEGIGDYLSLTYSHYVNSYDIE